MRALFFILLLVGVQGFGQPVFTSADMPAVGDRFVEYFVDTLVGTPITTGGLGANQIWDFANLSIRNNDPIESIYVNPALTRYANEFSNSNLCQYLRETYNYYESTVNDYGYLGSGRGGGVEIFSNSIIYFTLPFTYNSINIDNFNGTNIFRQDTAYIFGTTKIIGDAYGTLILPSGT